MNHFLSIAFTLTLFLAPGAALAADQHQMPAHQNAPAAADCNQDYLKAMDRMHGPMMEGIMDTDPDRAFVRGMIPHHRGAVEMAEIQLKYGKDPEIRKLAQEVIEAQKKEIEFMEEWLKRKK
jgi:Uncharacterized protein conserved in bacteria